MKCLYTCKILRTGARCVGTGLLLGIWILAAGCGPSAPEPVLPPGWEMDGPRWWLSGVDTSGFFRKLDTFEDMGVEPVDVVFGTGRITLGTQRTRAVQRRLIPLYRNQPTVVDSLFRRYVVPRMERDVPGDGHPEDRIEPFVQDAYRAIARHFREPRALSTIGKDVPLPALPDSLNAYSGRVGMQIVVDTLGRSVSIELLESLHPELDRAAMRALTEMRWSPAYLHGKPIQAWARFYLRFGGTEG